ncbi:glycosyl hydrolase [Streptomyces sp. NPDC101455]|uniref:glycosyl hydrolase n=1 Tax=Streptomyces sp. NPDC101455 TaxID=3366142 RepID=UPI00382B5431
MTEAEPSGPIPLHARFLDPGPGWGPMPFFWWSGGPVDRDRLTWQLDQLAGSGVAGTVVGYSHRADSTLDADDPLPLTPDWWDLFTWFVEECARRELSVGLQDYILLNDILRSAGADTPGTGAGSLQAEVTAVGHPGPVTVTVPAGTLQVAALSPSGECVDLTAETGDSGAFTWAAPGTGWEIVVVTVEPANLYGEPLSFDVLHPDSGQAVIRRLYQPFADRLGDRLGTTFTVFFQDELDLGIRMPMWSARVPEEFRRRTGYDLMPLLAGLWRDVGPDTQKLRLDYSDVVVALLEESYFKPVHEWQRAHGTMLAMDQLGRGDPRIGRSVYGDYSRTMRWYDAPGNEDPKLHEPRRLESFKVNSSLAHLYERPRVWNEAFHSSGWGVTPEQVLAGVNEGFAYGATSVSLHGLYHSTRGGWWEWASPDFHFRQPYWRHATGLWHHISRLSWLLSQGSHGCDVAVLDPAADLAAEPAQVSGMPLAQPDPQDTGQSPEAAECALEIIRQLVRAGCDADLIDDDSLQRATSSDGRLRIAGESYQVLIVPSMRWIRSESLHALSLFLDAGGLVIAYDRLPEPIGAHRDHGAVAGQVRKLWGRPSPSLATEYRHSSGGLAVLLPRLAHADATLGKGILNTIARHRTRAVRTDDADLLVTHRLAPDFDVYLMVNASDTARTVTASLSARGPVERWNAEDGSRLPVSARHCGQRAEVDLDLLPGQAVVLVSGDHAAAEPSYSGGQGVPAQRTGLGTGPKAAQGQPAAVTPPKPARRRTIADLDGTWQFRLVPTTDNRFGDFRLPSGPLGPEGHLLDTAATAGGEPRRVSYGPRMWRLGPIPPGADSAGLTEALRTLPSGGPFAGPVDATKAFGLDADWRPYEFSEQFGIEKDPLLADPQTGPHGLKGQVPLEFIDLGGPEDAPAGSVTYLWTSVDSPRSGPVRVIAGSRSEYSVWLNGAEAIRQAKALAPAGFPPWDVPDYRSPQRLAEASVLPGSNSVLARFVHSGERRLRGYFVVESAEFPPDRPLSDDAPPSLHWWAGDRPALSFDPEPDGQPDWTDYVLTTPPGLTGVTVTLYGDVRVRSAAGPPDRIRTAMTTGGARRVDAEWNRTISSSCPLRLRVRPDAGRWGGAVFREPVAFRCVNGVTRLGDWSRIGLASYSGAATYTKTITIRRVLEGRVRLSLGEVCATASLTVNGQLVGTTFSPPHEFDVTGLIRRGRNVIEVEVANTLANLYSTLPTPYVLDGQHRSGLLGPVILSHGWCTR